MPPFTLIADKNKKERVYAWGTCQLKDRSHSDFMLLKELVIKQHLELMHKQAYRHYDRTYRQPRVNKSDVVEVFRLGFVDYVQRQCLKIVDFVQNSFLNEYWAGAKTVWDGVAGFFGHFLLVFLLASQSFQALLFTGTTGMLFLRRL